MLFLDRVFSFSTTRNKAHALENTISNTTPINPLALSFPLSSAEYFSSFQVTCINFSRTLRSNKLEYKSNTWCYLSPLTHMHPLKVITYSIIKQ